MAGRRNRGWTGAGILLLAFRLGPGAAAAAGPASVALVAGHAATLAPFPGRPAQRGGGRNGQGPAPRTCSNAARSPTPRPACGRACNTPSTCRRWPNWAVRTPGTIFRRQLQRRLSDDPGRAKLVLDRPGPRHPPPRPGRLPAALAPLPGDGRRSAARPVLRGRDGLLPRVRRRAPPAAVAARAGRPCECCTPRCVGLRHGVPPQTVGEGRLGEVVARLWRHRPDRADPLVVRVLVESLRLLQRADHAEHALVGQPLRRRIAPPAVGRTADPRRRVRRLPDRCRRPVCATPWRRRTTTAGSDLLAALEDLRADAAAVVLPLVRSWPAASPAAGVRLLAFGREPEIVRRI